MANKLPHYYTHLKRLVNFLEKSKIVKGIFFPIRYVRDVIWFSQRTKGSYRWLAQFFESDDLKNQQDVPFALPILNPTPIVSMKIPGLWNMNPTVSVTNSEVRIFTRATSFVFNPRTNSRGHNSLTTTNPITKCQEDGHHSVVRNALLSGILTSSGELVNEEILIPESPPPTFEDVRPFKYKDRDHLIGTWTTQVLVDEEPVIRQSIAIYSIDKGVFLFIESPFNLSTEKNWVPIQVVGDKLLVFYSSQPARILEINLLTSGIEVIPISSHASNLNFHGRSQLVKLHNGNFLRVASMRLPLKDFGLVHFSFFVEHGPNFEEIRISRPFLFQTPGFEICNGLQFRSQDELILTWGCNDKTSYFACVSVEALLEWLNEKELRVINPRSRNWRSIRANLKRLESVHACECKVTNFS
jgi:hypothetical protein